MSHYRANLTDNLIKQQVSAGFNRFRDPRYPLVLRMHASRKTGSWFLVDFKSGNWHKVGVWPLFNCKKMLELVPDLMTKHQLDLPVITNQFETVSELLAWFSSRQEADKTISEKRRINIKSTIETHLIPKLGQCELATFSNVECENHLIWPMQNDDYALSSIRHHFQLLKRAFDQAEKTELIERNPLKDTTFKSFIQTAIKPKKARLSIGNEPELALSLLKPNTMAEMMCWFMLLHGTRIGETRQLKWEFIDTTHNLITLPEEITKTTEHVIPLTDHALKTLIDWHKRSLKTNRSKYIFPAKKRGPISESDASKLVNQVSNKKWSAHDLRKFCRGRWLIIGIDSVVAELLLNHKLTDLQQTYLQEDPTPIKREALARWADHLHAVKTECETKTETRSYDFNALN
ncbi:hypothetical protein AUR67_00405 [Pseudoalteromonas sp. XI10]|uniref:tyrosine-type recombinase/integrase n=1 Tax=Pseudoalteromonas sp. XI10 TaxID=1766621 RepID=UPI000733984C|nr:tyrosine-type recombinase/integrase [Pseudoalteromonas sp. XI10]KTG21973.1 hypothetical protein AUR67_00405 [Pseudoalteromonas sp. XI10]